MRFLLVVLFALTTSFVIAQNDIRKLKGKIQIETLDGTILSGDIIEQDGRNIKIKTAYGESSIPKNEIKSFSSLNPDDVEDDETYSGSHYLFGQSAFGLKKGQSYYENTMILLNSYTVGVTDNFSLSMGGEAGSLLFGASFPSLYFIPKFSFPFEKGAFSISSIILTVPTENFTSVGFLTAGLTLGDLENNFTIGTGVGFSFSEGFAEGIYPVTLSGIFRVKENLSLVTENWIVTESDFTEGIVSLGVRFHSKKNNNFLTVSLFRPTVDTDSFIAFPFFSGTIALK